VAVGVPSSRRADRKCSVVELDRGPVMPRPERSLDPSDGPVQLFAGKLRRLRQRAGSPGYREMARTTGYSMSTLSDAAGGRRLPRLPVVRAYVAACGDDPVAWEPLWLDVAAALAGRDASPQEPPYQGLVTFQPADADRFFGRAELVNELVEQLRRDHLLVIVGASGRGKSSLLRAGLLPVLNGSAAATGTEPLLFNPGARPFAEFGPALRGSPSPELIMVDQFEELFTLCRDAAERKRFVDALLDAWQRPGTSVVITLRADFYGHCAFHRQFAEALRGSTVLIGPMCADQLRQVVTGPAALAGLTVERALLTKVVDDAAGQPGALPLVSHALLETWRHSQRQTLTLADYEAAGGVTGAIAQTAERVYGGMDEAKRAVLRRILTRLTALGEGTQDTRRRVARDELAFKGTAEVLDRLVEARLVVVDENTVEIAHEALIAGWPRLAEWLREDRDGLRTHRQLGEAATIWRDLARERGALYRGSRLALAREWAERGDNERALTPLERSFLAESLAAESGERVSATRRSRQLRLLTACLAALLALSVAAGAGAFQQWRSTAEQKQQVQSRQLAAQAADIAPSDVAGGLAQALAAYRMRPTVEARSVLLSLASRSSYAGRLQHAGPVKDVAFSPDGSTLATAGQDGHVTVWDPARRTRLAVLSGHGDAIRCVAYHPDGTLLAAGGLDGTVIVWDTARWARVLRLEGHRGAVDAVAFSPDGTLVAAVGEAHEIRLWRAGDGSLAMVLPGHGGKQSDIAFSPDGQRLVSAGDDGTAVIWDLASRMPVGRLPTGTPAVYAVAYSPDGRLIATAGDDRDIALWQADTGRRLSTLRGHNDAIRSLAFAADGSRLLSASYDQTAAIWDVRRGSRLARLAGHTSQVYGIAVSPDGRTVASAGRDQNVLLWQRSQLPLTGQIGEVLDLSVSRTGGTVASAATDGSAVVWNATTRDARAVLDERAHDSVGPDIPRTGNAGPDADLVVTRSRNAVLLWDAATAAPAARFTGHTDRVFSVAMQPGGRLLASGAADDTVRVWDTVSGTVRSILTIRGTVQRVAFTARGDLLVVGTRKGDVVAWDTATWRIRYSVQTGGELADIAVRANGDTVAVAGPRGDVDLWDPARGRRLATLRGHSGPVDTLAFSPDGKILASGGQDGRVVLWKVDGRAVWAVLVGHEAGVNAAAWSPDGDVLYTGGADHSVIPWRVRAADAVAAACRTLAVDFPGSSTVGCTRVDRSAK
jgi:WD40 repeat protein